MKQCAETCSRRFSGLFGGEASLLAQVNSSLQRGGVGALAVLAGVVDAAAALARAGQHSRIVQSSEEAAAVASCGSPVRR
jgi:protein ImuB